MRRIVLYEDEGFVNLLPLVFWRSVFELRVGRKILLDRTAQGLGLSVEGVWTRDWIASVASQRCGAPANRPCTEFTVLVNGRWIFDGEVELPPPPCIGFVGEEIAYVACDAALAGNLNHEMMLDPRQRTAALAGVPQKKATGSLIRYPWDIVRSLSSRLLADWRTDDATIEVDLDPRTMLSRREWIHIGEKALIHPTAVLDAERGPIYLGRNACVGAYAVLEGPIYLGPGSIVHPHARFHGGNAIGPQCKVGGELDGCVLDGYTNKQHHGFLGHAYVGSWVNLGAGTTNSDLKNTYGSVKVPINGTLIDSGETFFGAVIGDHAKIGIHGALPTGAVIGLAAMTATTRLLPAFVPSFGWFTEEKLTAGDPARLLDVATKVMARRQVDMTDEEVELFLDLGARVRSYEQGAPS